MEIANPDETIDDADNYAPEAYDEYATTELMIPIGDEWANGVVKKRVKDDDGLPVGVIF